MATRFDAVKGIADDLLHPTDALAQNAVTDTGAVRRESSGYRAA